MDKNDLQYEPEKVPITKPELVERHIGKVAISCGWDGDDYVLHFSTVHKKLRFKIPEKNLLLKVIGIMKNVIPSDCEVNIWTPYEDWDLRMYTVKAKGLNNYWQISEDRLKGMLGELFTELNKYV